MNTFSGFILLLAGQGRRFRSALRSCLSAVRLEVGFEVCRTTGLISVWTGFLTFMSCGLQVSGRGFSFAETWHQAG